MEALNTITTNKPPEITFDTLTLDTKDIKIEARSLTGKAIQQYYVNLKANDKFGNVKMGEVSTSEESPVLLFSISLILI